MGWFWTLTLRLHAFAGPVVMLLYPLYASIKAIESPSKEDDQQWLAYWILYSFIALFELAAAPLLAWIPLWSTMKLVLACWLVLPPFHGAAFLYEWLVRERLLKHHSQIEQKLSDSQRRFLRLLSPGARSSLEHYIAENGSEAFDNIIAAAAQEANRNRLSPNKERQERY